MTAMPSAVESPLLVDLADPRAVASALTGGKASRLAAALQAGRPVPGGFVLTTTALARVVAGLGATPTPAAVEAAALPEAVEEALATALQALDGPVAVRSSGVAEDLEGASFAGQYETVLDVRGFTNVRAAVLRCLASAYAERVLAYRGARAVDEAPMAVLVQRYVPARAAGVAFTAHPVTGERDVTVVSAVAGVGDALVSGRADAEEWEVRGASATRRRTRAAVLSEAEALAVAELARSVADGAPTDVEWALLDGRVHLLQARPMTAVPEPVSWAPPHPGGWVRHFRLGEWLGAPVTPLFESWYLDGVEERQSAQFAELFSLEMPRPYHVTVNGWYYLGLTQPKMVWSGLPRLLRNLFTRFREMASVVPPLAHLGFAAEEQRWRRDLLPKWRAVVADAEAKVESLPLAELPALIESIVAASAVQAASILGVAGYAAKAEGKLFELWRKHLDGHDGAVNDLVVGADVAPAAHDVEGLDWVFPTMGERGPVPPPPAAEIKAGVLARREAAEARARDALPPGKRDAFARAVAEARRAHAVRLEQTGLFTLGHPVTRRALARIGAALAERGVLPDADAVHFLTRAELTAALAGEPVGGAGASVAARRARWERQRKLTPPLVVGELTGMFKETFAMIDELLHHPEHDEPDALVGMPGSPGRVTGPARVVRAVEELDRLQPGEILVAPVTTPMWTLAFGRALAVVTDTGSVASHASIVAREYGIPAVVGVGDATARIVDGQRITVDGGRGLVRTGG